MGRRIGYRGSTVIVSVMLLGSLIYLTRAPGRHLIGGRSFALPKDSSLAQS